MEQNSARSETHAAVSYYGETASKQFPLILLVGREPNSEIGRSHGLGTYDFDKWPRCAFWNVSYAAVAKFAGLDAGRALKRLSRDSKGSPLVYADAMPITLRNEVIRKHLHRRKVSRAECEAHADEVFSHTDIIKRVKLAFLSGLGDKVFESAVLAFKNRCVRHVSNGSTSRSSFRRMRKSFVMQSQRLNKCA